MGSMVAGSSRASVLSSVLGLPLWLVASTRYGLHTNWPSSWPPSCTTIELEARLPDNLGAVQRLPVPRSSEYPAFRRDHWAVGRPSVRVTCLPLNRCGQPVGESSHVSCRP